MNMPQKKPTTDDNCCEELVFGYRSLPVNQCATVVSNSNTMGIPDQNVTI